MEFLAIGLLLGFQFEISQLRRFPPAFFLAFGISRASMGFNVFIEAHAGISLHLEPLLICMSAGFFIRNATDEGRFFIENLDRVSMLVYVIFFCLAGAALNFNFLMMCWPPVIAINQVIGPVLFKAAIHLVGEAGKSRH